MLPRADLTGTRPLGPVDAPSPVTSVADARQETFNRLTQIAIGKQFQADIISKLNDGTYLVRIADTVARMNLPVGTKAGDTVPMTVISTDPRPTFLLGQQPNGPTVTLSAPGQLADRFLQTVAQEGVSAPVVAKPALPLAPTVGTEVPATPVPTAAPTSLSNTGRLINVILQNAQEQGAPATIVGKTPLIASSGTNTPQVANALRDSLTYSGLFYESHVAQWASGERTAAELLREPQAHLAQQHAGAASTQDGDQIKELRLMQNQAPDAQAKVAAGQSAEGDKINIPPTLNTEASRLINLQLDTLENRRVLWQGELSPGQPMEWEVSEDTPERGAPEAEQSWKSTVRFEMPTLGAVAATIHMVGGHVHVQVRAASDATAATLRTHGRDLASAMEAAGSALDSLTVKQDGQV